MTMARVQNLQPKQIMFASLVAQQQMHMLISYLFLFIVCAYVTAYVCPRQIRRPPDRPAALLPPAGLASTRGVLQHQWDECTELGLCHFVDGGRDAV